MVHGEVADEWVEVAPHQHIPVAQALVQLVARKRKIVFHQDREIGVVGEGLGTRPEALDARDAGQQAPIALGDLPALLQGLVDVLELQQPEGSADLVELAVDAGHDHRDLVDEAEILKVVEALPGVFVRADDRTALEGVEHLGGMEAEDAQVAVAQYAAAGVAHGEGMRGIVDDLQVVDIGDPLDRLDIAGVAVAMHRQDRGGLRGDRRLDPRRVEIHGVLVDVHEDRLEPVPQQRVAGGDEGVRRGDHLAGHPQCLQRGDERQGGVGEEHDVLHPQVLAQGLFQRMVHVAPVGQETALPDLFQVGDELFQGRQQRAGDRDRLVVHVGP
ncbi:hypothetical protein NCGM2_1951 [Pseudomonas aeruginosa NCGM2.S1]|nr:hypothetical protein NCGM2_1951 [Pseudomonas aeruginosa NCGM2.S1]